MLPLLRSLLKRNARIVVTVDATNSHCTKDMAAWLIEHLYLDNFVGRIALLDDKDGESNSNGFAEALKRLDVRPDEAVLFAGAQCDGRSVAAKEGVGIVIVDADAVGHHPEQDLRGREGGSTYSKKNDIKQADDGVWEIGGLMVARNAVRMTLNERDRSVDSARM